MAPVAAIVFIVAIVDIVVDIVDTVDIVDIVDTVDTLDTVHTVDNSPEEQRYGIAPSTGDAHVAHAHMWHMPTCGTCPGGAFGRSESPRWPMWQV